MATHLTVSLVSNLVGAVLSIPILILVLLLTRSFNGIVAIGAGITLLVTVLSNPVLGGVHVIARDLARREVVVTSDAWEGIREYWKVALRAYGISLPVSLVIFLNLIFYTGSGFARSPIGDLKVPIIVFWLLVLLLWLSLHLYIWPLMIEQERPSALLAFRNAAVLLLKRPLFTWLVTIFWILIGLVSAITGLVAFVGIIFGAVIQETALASLLPSVERMPEPAAHEG